MESGWRKERYRLSAESIKQTSVAPTNMISLYRGKKISIYNGLRVFDQSQLREACRGRIVLIKCELNFPRMALFF